MTQKVGKADILPGPTIESRSGRKVVVRQTNELPRRLIFARPGEHNGVQVWTINGKVFDPARMDAHPRLGSGEISELAGGSEHLEHLHPVHFKVLSRNGKEPLPTDAGWKDTVGLTEDERGLEDFYHFREVE